MLKNGIERTLREFIPHSASYCIPDLVSAILDLWEEEKGLQERIAQITAHRACCGSEHNPAQGKLHGCCVVCGIPFPCEYAGKPPSPKSNGE